MSTRLFLAVALTACPLLPSRAAAQRDSSLTLPSVSVTATRTSHASRSQPFTVTVFERESLRDAGVTHLTDVLRLVPGATVLSSGPYGSQASLFLRGGESDFVQVLVDGVPINAPGGALDFGQLTGEDVERIEVLRGPGSVLYGSDAVSGVIQIFTRGGRLRGSATRGAAGNVPARISALVGAGTHSARRYELGAAGSASRLGWAITGSQFSTDGILPFNNEFENRLASGGLSYHGERLTASGRLRYTEHTYHYPTSSSGELVDSNAFVRERRGVGSLDAGVRLTSGLELRGRAAATRGIRALRDELDHETDPDSYREDATLTRAQFEGRLIANLRRLHVLTLSAERQTDSEESDYRGTSEWGPYDGAMNVERRNLAVAAQLIGNAGREWSYSAGVRHDDNSKFGGYTTVRLAAAYRLSAATQLRASGGNAFKAPTFYENFASGFVTGNPDLRPERTRTLEAGLQHAPPGDNVTFGATVFAQKFRDLIQYVPSVPQGDPNFANLAGAVANGLELELGMRSGDGMTILGSYTYLRTRVTDAGVDEGPGATFVAGEPLLRRPRHTASITVREKVRGVGSLDFTVTRTGARDDRDFSTFPATPVEMKAFTRIDVAATRPLGSFGVLREAALLVRVENAANRRYEQVLGFPSPGRTLFIGVRTGD